MANVRCIMMQKNETKLLEPWFRYYGYLFGFENLEVIDNGSSEPEVLRILDTYERAGCKIHRGFNSSQDFIDKGNIVRDIIQDWDRRLDYDLALTVDCDEFIAIYDSPRPVLSRKAIDAYFDTLRDASQVMRIDRSWYNVPHQPGLFKPAACPKSILRRNTILSLDNGFHHPQTTLGGAPYGTTSFICFHMHNRSYPDMVRHSREKLAHYVDVDDRDAIIDFHGDCFHVKENLLVPEQGYLARFANTPSIVVPEIVDHLIALGIDLAAVFGSTDRPAPWPGHDTPIMVPTLAGPPSIVGFEAGAYLMKNPDVAESGLDPIFHYCQFGYKEPRL